MPNVCTNPSMTIALNFSIEKKSINKYLITANNMDKSKLEAIVNLLQHRFNYSVVELSHNSFVILTHQKVIQIELPLINKSITLGGKDLRNEISQNVQIVSTLCA